MLITRSPSCHQQKGDRSTTLPSPFQVKFLLFSIFEVDGGWNLCIYTDPHPEIEPLQPYTLFPTLTAALTFALHPDWSRVSDIPF
ncbi:hypothetical protein IQ268_09135 [Oculatella sp. LEGE 06141]|uniref:hypothetical protein n=1 Tax=Oculatella sp. LEGE 06141 TaxID=1828648 RepID=UPI001880A984|nr:hypothetical protein [Oculatella sp. LEGE 06141]MBE9178723.1 hypothetical protein [Oculatella sp. LEGE 06141]